MLACFYKKIIKFFFTKGVKHSSVLADIIIGGGQIAQHLGFSIGPLQHGVFFGQPVQVRGMPKEERADIKIYLKNFTFASKVLDKYADKCSRTKEILQGRRKRLCV